MASFAYKGRDLGGNAVEGIVDGASSDAASNVLFGRGITPLEIREVSGTEAAAGGRRPAFGDRIVSVDIALFTRQLYALLKAGVPIMRALIGLQESAGKPAMKALIGDVREGLESGRELSASMARHPRAFSEFYLSMVRVGEMTGMLDNVLLRLFNHLEFEAFMRNQVKSALRYPSFVIATMGIAIVIVNVMVIPAFAKVFAGFKTELPLMTRMLLAFSNFMVNYWYVLLALAAGAVFAFRAWVRTEAGRHDWDRIKLKIPIAGKIVRKATLARFAHSFALAMRAGVPVVQAMTVVAQTVDNAFMTRKIEAMRESVERGESVLRAAIGAKVFTPVVLQMIAVGEESGSLDDMMDEVSDMYQRDVEYDLKNLSSQIEPILIIFLGILVLILALGVFLPIWDLGKVAIK